ncbi:hypothetical protein GH714_012673 [Hevea brasiliensis]|uniref:Transcription initiation factor TFIID subunit 8 n=1 Tax=Hevea brasiliensis TaxID=3981 RepID=A0A6A6MMC7_HEVBR|nr:hypothetical protein GH714_012673 [Hevea brasiliensis]
MSHGGGESGRLLEKSQHAKRKSGASGDEFAQAIAKIAVAQICESAGFQTFQQSALEILSDATIQYIRNLGKLAQSYTNLAGRTNFNALDVIQGLEELGSSQGFADASDIDHCIASSGTRKEASSKFLQIGEEPPPEHIPAWLPAFPDPQTYVQFPTENEGATDSNTRKFELARLHTRTDRSLPNLQNYTGNGSGGPSSVAPVGGSEAKLAVEGNPFLAAPLQFGEKEVSHVVPPAKPSNEAAKKVLLNQRPAVQFKIGVGKKSLGIALELSSQNKGVEKMSPWSGKDSEKDDKKIRAEKILKQSTDNPRELAQL